MIQSSFGAVTEELPCLIQLMAVLQRVDLHLVKSMREIVLVSLVPDDVLRLRHRVHAVRTVLNEVVRERLALAPVVTCRSPVQVLPSSSTSLPRKSL